MNVAFFEEDPDEPEEPGRRSDQGAPAPEPLHAWRERGYAVGEARRWIAEGFALDDADRWRTSGVYKPDEAREWRTAGATPYTVDRMLRAGMTPRDAVRWREFGVPAAEAAERHLAGEDPRPQRWTERLRPGRSRRGVGRTLDEQEAATMRAMLRAGIPAEKARPYIDLGWHGTEAVAWAERSLDAGEAKLFHALGFSPAEAQRVAAQGADAISVMTDWWRAGVPIDEVSAWCGAGFTAEETADLRRQGVDVEQARVMRALTDSGG
ncbi:hypothetical protein GCM10010297_28050 [Streptomyces malachitofuscus]|nr:hypothetical protein GCM10010297_28050 [Streptomyces malachitofuscus]